MSSDQHMQGFRLSPQQRRYLQFSHGRAWLDSRLVLALEGRLDKTALREALDQLMQRHQILRTRFPKPTNLKTPLQVIEPQPCYDWSEESLPEGVEIQQWLRDHHLFMKQVDPAGKHLVDLRLIRENERRHLLLLHLPALLIDEDSLGNFVRELAVLYQAWFEMEDPFEEEPPQYLQFSELQYSLQEDEDGEELLAYWQNQNPGEPKSLTLPFETQDPHAAFLPKLETFEVRPELGERLAAYAETQELGEGSVVAACWAAVLWRFTGETEIHLSMRVPGRKFEEFDELFGSVDAVLPVSETLGAHWSLAALAARLDELIETGDEHSEGYLLHQLDQDLFLPPSEASFDFDQPVETIEVNELVFHTLRREVHRDRYKVKLRWLSDEREAQVFLHYDANQLDAMTARNLGHALLTVLDAALADAECSLAIHPMMDEAMRARLLAATHREALDFGPAQCMHRLISARANAQPEQIALVHEADSMSFGELEKRSNQMAHSLRHHGVGPEHTVAILADRGLRILVAMLAANKSGAAFTVLDPAFPAKRTLHVLEQVEPPVLVVEPAMAASLPDLKGLGKQPEMLDLEGDLGLWPEDLPEVAVFPENPLYLTFTSGSTGVPKGVVVEHRQMFNYMSGVCRELQPEAGWHFATVSTFSADLGHTSLFPSLVLGGTLHIISSERLVNPESLGRYFHEQQVDFLKIVPSHLAALIEASETPEHVLPRRCLVVGGETTHLDLAQTLHRLAPECRLFNHYGPSETTVGVITGEAGEMGRPYSRSLPLGKPFVNVQIYVLDAALNPVPQGVPGELFISGNTVTRGYLGRGGLTAERFLPNPFGEAGSRMYRTGDLVRQLVGGETEFLGRNDHQTKIRGYRVEMGEVEAVLAAHPRVAQCVAIMHREASGEARLVAYWSGGNIDTDDALTDWMAERLPGYMVPSFLARLDHLPLTSNGKIDRKALPKPEQAARVYSAPRDEMEELVTELWAEMLGVTRLGIHDNFFQLGGHSLKGISMTSRLRDRLGVEVPIQVLFEAPTPAAFAEHLGKLQQAEQTPIEVVTRDKPLPLSFAQQRLWVIERLNPGLAVYNCPAALRLRGPLDLKVLRACLDEILARHEVLRTHIVEIEGEPYQQSHPPMPMPFHFLDLSEDERGEVEAYRQVSEAARKPFDLMRAPLIVAGAIRLGHEDHVLWLNVHHIASDGWSTGILRRELSVLYPAFQNNQPSPLPPLPIQYADYAAWQRSWLVGDNLDRQLSYWRNRLGDHPPPLELPTDHARPPQQTNRGGRLSFEWPIELHKRLRDIAARHDASLFMAFLAGFVGLLHRLSHQDDISVGTTVAGRSRAELEGLIGFFVNTLVIRLDLSGAVSYEALLQQTRERCLEAYAHGDIPFEKLVETLSPERTMSHTPLFQVIFNMQNAEGGGGWSDLQAEVVDSDTGTAKFDLNMTLTVGDRSLFGSLEYSSDLFEASTLERWLAMYRRLMEGVAAQTETAISRVALLDEEEQQHLVGLFQPREVHPVSTSLHEAFLERARQHASRIALTFNGQQMTYAELEERTGKLAAHLRKHGVGPDVLVPICLERGLELIVAVLGVLRAGGAYVPVDPHYPEDRIAYLFEDSGARLAVCDADTAKHLPPGLDVVTLDDVAEATAATVTVDPHQLAYVIYTSGSTGKPKGVGVTHANVMRLFAASDEAYGFGPDDTWTMFHSYAFDFSVWEKWGALLYGGRLVIPDRWTVREPQAFVTLLARERVTVLNQTPSSFNTLIKASEQTPKLEALRYVIFGGEALNFAALTPWFEKNGDAQPQLVNMYGITETCVHVTHRPVRAEETGSAHSGLGQPIGDLGLFLLDRHLNPVPMGVSGELHVAGAGLARGYLGRPSLTAQRFVPHPFADGKQTPAGSRLYRSGDLGRLLENGEIAYSGRADLQVKIRGFRIELGEIENALVSQPGVEDALVMVRSDRETPYLAAYLVTDDTEIITSVREALVARLPEYMVPSAFVTLARFPRTAHDKIDRRALPAPSGDTAEYIAPSNDIERVLCELWTGMFARDQVGITDNFFALGGHSLLGVTMIGRLRQRFGVDIPIRTLFEEPTPAGLARRIVELADDEEQPLERVDRSGRLPLSYAQQRLWVIDRLAPGQATYNMPTALRLEGSLDLTALRATLDRILLRHEALRTRFLEADGEPYQEIMLPMPVPFQWDDLSGERDARARAEDIVARAAKEPFALDQGPMIRAGAIKLGEQSHILWLNIHHIAGDGWSIGIIKREIAALYPALKAGRTIDLPEIPYQYVDYAVWQRNILTEQTLTELRDYWAERIGSKPEALALPTDHPRPAVMSGQGARVHFQWQGTLRRRVAELAKSHDATPFMTLTTALMSFLSAITGQAEISVGSTVAGRRRSELEAIVGFFVNTVVLRTDLSADPNFRQLLLHVRELALDAFAKQDLPFEKLVEMLSPEREMNRSPLFQVLFNLQTLEPTRESWSDLEAEVVEAETGSAKFDLNLSLVVAADGLHGTVEYNTDILTAETVNRWVGALHTHLEAALQDPDTPVSQLPLLAQAERTRLLEPLAPSKTYEAEGGLAQAFARQMNRAPEQIALIHEDKQYSYSQLAQAAGCLAGLLQARGVGRGEVVPLCIARSDQAIIAMLAVAQLGAVYIPIDDQQPTERIAFIVADCGARIAIHDQANRAKTTSTGADWVLVETASPAQPYEPVAQNPMETAYVIYTSGSTGQPKGVAVSHRSVLRLFRSNEATFGFGPADVFVQAHSHAFDVSVWEIWGALLHGARLVVPEYWTVREPGKFGRLLSQQNVTILCQTPSAFKPLQSWLLAEQPELSLRHIIFAGEALNTLELQAWIDHHGTGKPRLNNMYGPTESCVYVTHRRIEAGDATSANASIGRGLDDLGLYVLDRHLRPQPLGIPGELCIGGPALAQGYIGRPSLSAERFVPHPFTNKEGGRLYRTGDLVRLDAQHEIVYLGRIDHQVKVRGYRIETGEIENALLGIADIAGALVMVRSDRDEPYLAAYVLGSEENQLEHIRTVLAQRLPEYMVPAAFVFLDEFPLNVSGKIDRRALPAPGHSTAGRTAYAAPLGGVELALAEIWVDLLGVDRIGRHDHFFQLGGHSLMATRLSARLRDRLGLEVPLRTVFERPTLAALAEVVARGKAADAGPQKVPRTGPLPMSFAQQRMWFLEQLDPGTPRYNLPSALVLRGDLDRNQLEQAINQLVARHEILRTVYRSEEGRDVQVILPITPVKVAYEELDAAQDLEIYLRGLVWTPFDLEEGPVCRFHLIRVDSETHYFVMNLHHIAGDGWSLDLLIRELSMGYAGATLPEKTLQYADFAVWQRDKLNDGTMDAQFGYWQHQLEGAPPELELPLDNPRQLHKRKPAGSLQWQMDDELAAGLRTLALGHDTTVYTALLALFQIWLHRVSGSADISVGSPVSGRHYPSIEDVCGFFVNTLVMRTRFYDDPSYSNCLERARETTREGFANADLPFEMLVERLNPERSTGRTPLFQVMFALVHQGSAGAGQSGPLTMEPLSLPRSAARFDLHLTAHDDGNGLHLNLDYDADLFEEETVGYLLAAFETLVGEAVAEPRTPVSRLRMQDARSLTVALQTTMEYPVRGDLFDTFSRHVAEKPEAPALHFETTTYSYGQLAGRANRVAHALRQKGIGAGEMVPLYLDRTGHTISAMLGVLQVGAAYVPLDVANPTERVAFVLQDTGARVALCDSRTQDKVPAGAVEWLSVDHLAEADEIAANPVSADWIAYMIYTSGSTGRPKGVAVSHGNVLRLFEATMEHFHFTADDAFLHFHSYAFDVSVFEIWGALKHGGRLLVLDQMTLRDGKALAQQLRQHGTTILCQTPTAFFGQLMPELMEQKALPALRAIVFAGEALPTTQLAPWMERYGIARPKLINMYGPTEATVYTTYRELTREDGHRHTPSIGKGLVDLRMVVLDRYGRLAPVGIDGELHISGSAVARGYWGRPALTAERFIPDPNGMTPGSRMYRTGDLGRLRHDGEILYLGRLDHQVKIRGYRIELGEIEAVLTSLAGVKQGLVMARQDRDLPYLAAYVIPEEGTGEAELREELGRHLPEYMIPAAIIMLESFPLTANGKLDQRALPSPDQLHTERVYDPPRGEMEQRIAQIWCKLLGLDQIGREDHFFQIGGHSLLATRLVAAVGQQFKQEVPLRTIFEAPRLSDFAAALVRMESPRSSLVHLAGEGETFYLVHGIDGHVAALRQFADAVSTRFGLRVVGLEAPGLEHGKPLNSIDDLACFFAEEIEAAHEGKQLRLGGWSMGGLIALELASRLRQEGQTLAPVLLLDSVLPSPEQQADKLLPGLPEQMEPVLQRALDGDREALYHLHGALQAAGQLPDMTPERLKRYMKVWHAHHQALKTYQPKAYIDPVILVQAQERDEEELARNLLEWQRHLPRITLMKAVGNHHTHIQEPQLATLLTQLEAQQFFKNDKNNE